MAKMTIEELLEIEEIKNPRMLYSHYYDGVEVEKLVDLFTDDAICEFGPNLVATGSARRPSVPITTSSPAKKARFTP